MNTQSQNQQNDKERQLTLGLLQAIDEREDISQRRLAQEMGVALGLANLYLKRCVKKGWIKITTAPANRYLYYLTPIGFAEKARLTADFFSTSLTMFRQAGAQYSELYEQCLARKWPRVVLVGLSDLTEIAVMRALQTEIEVIAVYQADDDRNDYFGVPVLKSLPSNSSFDCLVLSSMEQTTELILQLENYCAQHQLSSDRIVVPELLRTMKYRQAE